MRAIAINLPLVNYHIFIISSKIIWIMSTKLCRNDVILSWSSKKKVTIGNSCFPLAKTLKKIFSSETIGSIGTKVWRNDVCEILHKIPCFILLLNVSMYLFDKFHKWHYNTRKSWPQLELESASLQTGEICSSASMVTKKKDHKSYSSAATIVWQWSWWYEWNMLDGWLCYVWNTIHTLFNNHNYLI